ncbi:uncharacterized protein C8Q71DRAFT_873543 [Rhodofomes roseus]|uniref:Uncharacterized protein n=1 Tax=Rhodofomes roseus TaxID=34475 RepID=A0ABQ8K9S1_9APHY|nr:uncharacterized protein C8Q71DRAFT_873543 [Rhodofomes roseus]KAH9834100.1 hypothetical protein C8Q71DRAFT_873543 [Rhodofomes roseus]
MPYTFQVGNVLVSVDWDDLLSLLIVALFVRAFLYLRRTRVQAPASPILPATSISQSGSAGLAEKEPKTLRYGSGKAEGGAWDATGPGYLPDPDPLLEFDLKTATLRDYVYVNKALRYPYFQTMAHQPLHINDWIEIDKEYQWYLDEKARVMREQGKNLLQSWVPIGRVVVDSLPENDAACTELLETLVDYLPKRYPTLFDAIPSKTLGPVPDGIHNKVTGETFTNISNLKGIDALMVVTRLVMDDFLMGREREDGKVYLVGGVIVFPGSYLLSEKIGQPIHQLHAQIPHFNKMLTSVERTMVRFAPDRPFERCSWWIADDRELFWHNIISNDVREDMHPKDLFLRFDHQTFRKLPKTKGIMFGVHPVLKRMQDLADNPLVPALLAKIHTDSDETLMKYKGVAKYQHKLIPYLQELTEQQIAKGLIKREDIDAVVNFRDHPNAGETWRGSAALSTHKA